MLWCRRFCGAEIRVQSSMPLDAQLVVTRDQDLLALNTFRGIRILAAREALIAIAATSA